MRKIFFYGLAFLSTTGWAASEKNQPPGFRVDVDTVVVRVSVMDPLNRYVVGLKREDFKLFEDKIEQTVTHFSNGPAPLSVGFVFDTSGSMEDNILSARNSVVSFLEQSDPDDEYVLITFNDRARLLQGFTSRGEDIQNEISISSPKGRTALYDALYLGLEKMRDARHDKKALIIITDGEDNSSRYTFTEVKELAQESDVLIYVIGERGELGFGRFVISDIAGLTGGRAFFPDSFKQLEYLVDLIHAELRAQYLLSYTPTNRRLDGRWRKIKVRLDSPEGLPDLKVRAKEGYLAPKR